MRASAIRLATQIGLSLMGCIVHPRRAEHRPCTSANNDKLIATLRHLRDLGNTVIVVEHDEDTMYASDFIVDIGPGAGVHGGEVVCAGPVEAIKACERSVTGQYLSGRKKIPIPETRRQGNGKTLHRQGARRRTT